MSNIVPPASGTYVAMLRMTAQGVKVTFFPGSHLAPKHFKVVAYSKKLVAIMTHTQKKTSHASINSLAKRDEK